MGNYSVVLENCEEYKVMLVSYTPNLRHGMCLTVRFKHKAPQLFWGGGGCSTEQRGGGRDVSLLLEPSRFFIPVALPDNRESSASMAPSAYYCHDGGSLIQSLVFDVSSAAFPDIYLSRYFLLLDLVTHCVPVLQSSNHRMNLRFRSSFSWQ